MTKLVIGIFEDYPAATDAVQALRNEFPAEKVSLIGQDTEEMRPLVSHLTATDKPDKVVTNFGVAGALAGLVIGLMTIAIPGTGTLIVAGPLMAALSGAAAGSIIGTIAGGLVHFDVPETEAHMYEAHLTAGKVLVALHADTPEERMRAEEILDQTGAIEVDTKAA